MKPVISTQPILQLASGDILSLQVYRFVGVSPGKKVYLQANLHGSEISGNAVLYQLIQQLQNTQPNQLAGEIWLVPVCNPLAVNQRAHHFASGRYNPYDGKDWNRIFWERYTEHFDLKAFAHTQIGLPLETIQHNYQQQLQQVFQAHAQTALTGSVSQRFAYRLQSLCLDADYLIDLHSSSNQGLDYLYCFRGRQASANYFLLDQGISFDQYDGGAFDEAFMKPWLALEDQLSELSRATVQLEVEAWTLELGAAMQMKPTSVAKGVRGILNYLARKGVLNQPGFPCAEGNYQGIKLTPLSQIQLYHAPAGGVVSARCELGASVEAGDVLYQLLSFNKAGELPTTVEVGAQGAGLVFDLSINHTVNEGELVLKLLPN
ncbi:succinylglutamate desuccinylase/aspartoacylase family protein [Leptolyngbya sp. FACHB-261]|uniref:succinylglutamate desuccinylase/aspartoacylase family protein n=1 Tax=Leptolyngbya sp. FACHB-261 TaxID=2692806 RepID=UPI0016893E7E|nr:succinylglutamate desuccinylase/aspartoacylase family protein [Leptolyngbya sp. FACHB-261]MBD2105035.1 succinylglutamate desuccinylase/aspartoacylase family protein [Leptolyngbya sp. FACHB-261]